MHSIQITQTIYTDLLIVGSGIAGLAAAVEAERLGLKTMLISKTPIGSGASFFPLKATLGIQVTGENDSEKFRLDIERVGKGRINPKVVKAYIEDSPQAIGLLEKIGFKPWLRNDNRPACFAEYPRPIYLINNWREAAQRAKQILDSQSTNVYEQATLLHIVTEQNQVQGAVFSLNTSGQICYIFCKTSQIILASGGIAGLYKDNLYPADIIGSTHSIAQQAGAKLTNLAFIQFIPSFVEPKYKVLFGEHTLKYVTKITDENGQDLFSHLTQTQFQQMMLARSHYAPFSVDFTCVEFDLVMMKHLLANPQQKGIYLHYTPELYQDKQEFYTVYLNWLRQEVGIDLVKDKIAIAPFAHSCNGGIEINEHGESCVAGLFAIGEIAHCIEGANRLGGNSVGGGLVFATRAVAQAVKNLQKTTKIQPLANTETYRLQAEKVLNRLNNPNGDNSLLASELPKQIREQMARFANVYRTKANLILLLNELQQLEKRFNPLAHHQQQGIEIFYALKTAQLVVSQMLNEPNSLGAHYLADEQ
ncbi:FAD-binding protein [Actinobacillus equuli]|uniref:FAD-binding protein n=1 Tax=Actinobacillus equuli TaxID=718 RepID=UPI00244104B1|nr:FAD-binding protein [Actinobacillus equuli]WGE58038.1 FAD-binding protein [Actinobacillus equuli subsp. equuli]